MWGLNKVAGLCEKCLYSELFLSECGKIQTRITPNTETFRAVGNKDVYSMGDAINWKGSLFLLKNNHPRNLNTFAEVTYGGSILC